jgi:anti-anti-sigma factor
MDHLAYDIERHADQVHVRLSGVLDLATRPTFADVADDALDGPKGPVVIDLTALDFLDSTGVVELIRTARRAEDRGIALRFIGPRDSAARRTADVVGLARILGWDDPEAP